MADQKEDSRSWFLRIASGTVFGPVSTQGLVTWAAQGRVLAGNEVSTNRKQWCNAESLSDLDISWYIEDDERLLTGPFHRRVAEKIIASGAGQGGGRLVPAAEADPGRVRRPETSRPGAASSGVASSGAQPELDLEGAASGTFAPAEAAPAAWIEEREGLRLRIAEIETQTQNLLRAAEKETRALNRQLDNARKQIAAQQAELEELRQLAAGPAEVAAETCNDGEKAALEEALETARREIADRSRAAERESDALRARIAELERLRAEQEQALAARKDVEALKVRIAELVGQIAEHDETAESVAMLQARGARLEEALRRAQGSYTELLAFSNSRDQENQEALQAAGEQQAAMQARLEAAESSVSSLTEQLDAATRQEPVRVRELAARLRDQETLVAGVLAEGMQVAGQLLASERESFAALRDGSVARQTLLQARLAALQKQQGGETGDVFEREAKLRTDRANSARTQDTLDALQQEHARHVRQAEAREHELVNRIRALELEEERLKARVAEAEPLFQRNQHLTELLQDREQKLAQERQQRSIEQAQLEDAHQALMAQIDSARQKDAHLPLAPPEDGEAGAAPPPPARDAFRAPPWMRLRK